MEKSLRRVMNEDVAGKEEIYIARRLARTVEAMGGDGLSFAAIVASGPNGAEPHAHAGQKLIAPDQPLVIDAGAYYRKYASDITRTYLPQGEGDKKWRAVYPVVRQALQAAIEGIRPGMQGHEADDIARQIITNAGYGRNFGHSLGHGVGLMVHEAPSLSPRSREVLKPGMVFTLEPGIYIPGWGGIRLEQMVELTPPGCRLLNRLDDFYDIHPA
jgi:Xaa-Pro aminopeptidase